ncbi:hypothetical protein EYF80_053323 [Liparis tanakae]|uniref:Uncharacterized protein n=1 Tax=Liparis tanakae TaxID=230148 RepID=A0A4Z2F6M0_9TELE|nr:hypothetical protein EYF80_053323 [Liparis tanakae]
MAGGGGVVVVVVAAGEMGENRTSLGGNGREGFHDPASGEAMGSRLVFITALNQSDRPAAEASPAERRVKDD